MDNAALGIQDQFINHAGETQQIATAQLMAVRAALLDGIDDAEGLHHAQASRLLPAVAVFTRRSAESDHTDTKYCVTLNVPKHWLQHTVRWHLQTEQDVTTDPTVLALSTLPHSGEQTCDGSVYQQLNLLLDVQTLPDGYHQLHLQICDERSREREPLTQASMTLILAPARCHEPQWSQQQKKLWGFSIQLYSLCSERSWGIGDFLDLRRLIRLSAAQGAGFLVLNPLHAGPLHEPGHCSPYSPVDRRFLNPLYIAPELLPQYDGSDAARWMQSEQAQQLLQAACEGEWVNYAAVTELKLHTLALLFEQFFWQTQHPGLEFFCRSKGKALQDYSRWQAQHPCQAAGRFAEQAEFYSWLQWLAESQLEACQRYATEQGMVCGLVRDLAVGSNRAGTEVSCSGNIFARGASIGAPPDLLAPQGQNWGLPPLNPLTLQEQGYRHFIDLLRSNMAHCGALRIDHVMSLVRLWWCPDVESGLGAYVSYPADDLFAILRLESQRQQCLVIGEDLGIVPEEARRHLAESGVFSNLLFYFEKRSAHEFRAPDKYAERALAMLANHDVPTLAAWWSGADLALRDSLGLFADGNQLAQQRSTREAEKNQVLQMLHQQGLLETSPADAAEQLDDRVLQALLRSLAASASRMVSLQPEELMGVELPVNIPGTSLQYRNWQRRLPPNLLSRMESGEFSVLLDALQTRKG